MVDGLGSEPSAWSWHTTTPGSSMSSDTSTVVAEDWEPTTLLMTGREIAEPDANHKDTRLVTKQVAAGKVAAGIATYPL